MFIIIKKIITQYEKEADGKTNVKDPRTEKPIPVGVKIAEETIRVDEIKSARSWHKSAIYTKVEGDITALYMLGTDRSKKPAEIHINENYLDFSKRIGAITSDGV